ALSPYGAMVTQTSTCAQVEAHVGLRLAFFFFISVSVAAPTLMMATPPIVARRAAEIRGRPIHFSKMSTKPASPDAPLRVCAARADGVLSGLTLSPRPRWAFSSVGSCPHQGSFPQQIRLPLSHSLAPHNFPHCCSESGNSTEKCKAST